MIKYKLIYFNHNIKLKENEYDLNNNSLEKINILLKNV